MQGGGSNENGIDNGYGDGSLAEQVAFISLKNNYVNPPRAAVRQNLLISQHRLY